MSSEADVLDAFKAAALSLTKLYKTSGEAQANARSDGYQDCLRDLLSFLDKEAIGVATDEGTKIRAWTKERIERREAQNAESEDDELDKAETVSSPEIHRSNSIASMAQSEIQMRDSAPPSIPAPIVEELPEIVVPSQDNFTFISQPHDLMAGLQLSDSRTQEPSPRSTPTAKSRTSRARVTGRSDSRSALGRGSGQKRKINFDDFDIAGWFSDAGGFGGRNGKDTFGNGGKRSRHV